VNWLAIPFRWLLAAPARWMGSVRGFLGWSLQLRVAIMLFVFLLLCVVGYYVASWNSDDAVADPKFHPRFILSWLVLLIAIPVAAYYAVRAWLETEPSQYPDLDEAWQQGVTAISKAGINIDECPLFLATGVASPREADNLMQAVDWDLLVEGEPSGKSPLRWYASREAIVVYLLDASATSLLQQQVQQAVPPSGISVGDGGARGTLVGFGSAGNLGSGLNSKADSPAGNMGIRGTIISGEGVGAAAAPLSPPPNVGLRGTMLASSAPAAATATANPAAYVNLDRKEIADQADRLARVCRLAAEARQPLCPINGSVAIVDWQTLAGAPAGQLSTVVREDATRMIEATNLHAPMALLITGLDDEMGFIELTRRVGENRARENRFGHGFNHQAPLEAGQLAILGKQACGAFEDWIYELFRHPDALGRTNNDKLYALLCKMRSEVQPKVVELVTSLSGACVPSGGRGPLLCGCYFGAAGGSRMRQAFVRSVFAKLLELEEDLEWSDQAWQKEFAFSNVVSGMLVMNALLFVTILGLLIFHFFFS
jgi:hypothetical protein